MKKRFLSGILILAIILSIFVPVLAVEEGNYLNEAEKLKTIGVFSGTDTGFELEREATRIEGIAMLIRLLGKEDESDVLKGQSAPFTDIPDWASGYVNYAYENGLTKGIGKGLFGSNQKLKAEDYISFMLRALGYDDSQGDFSYDKSIEFARDKNIIQEDDELELNSQVFLRDHVVKISMLTLNSNIKDGSQTLLEKLVDEGVILKSTADSISEDEDSNLEVHFIDVGQADAIFIKKGNQAMMVDAGNNGDGEMIVDYIKKQGIDSLKYVIGTHPHADHIGGLDDVIDSFEIEKIIMPDVIATTQTFEDVIDSISKKGLSITKPNVGDKYDLNGALVTVLAPNGQGYYSMNDYSIVVRLEYGENSFLLTGDAEETSEIEMVDKNADILSVDLLKLGHHGSITSTSKEFLDAVDPEYAVITVGRENRYGHPDDEVLARLASKDIQIYRTDLDGNIIAISDGNKIRFYKGDLKDKETESREEKPLAEEPLNQENAQVKIILLDKFGEIVVIRNDSGDDVDLTGWTLLSVTGDQEFIFPEYILEAGGRVTITSGVKDGDLEWGRKNIWNNSTSDPAVLFDADKNQVYWFND